MVLYRCTNNGTIALVPERIYDEIEKYLATYQRIQQEHEGHEPGVMILMPPYPRPIFTFVDSKYLGEDLHLRYFVTGSYELMGKLTEGHSVYNRSFHVPFSNCYELNPRHPLHAEELKFRTTFEQVVEEFGIRLTSHGS